MSSTGSRVPPCRPSDLNDEQLELYVELTEGPRAQGSFGLTDPDGSLVGPFGPMVLAPGVGRALSRLGEAIRFASVLPARLREIVILAVAAHHHSHFEWYAHEKVAGDIGFTPGDLSALMAGTPDHWDDERERTAHRTTLALLARRELTDEEYEDGRDRLGADVLIEIITAVGYYQTLDLLLRAFAIDAPDHVEE